MDNAQKIWDRLISAGCTPAGAAGLLGNLDAESGLNPQNLQNSYEKKLGYSDADYTAAVDCGAYDGFVSDGRGTGWPSGRTPAGKPHCWPLRGQGAHLSATWICRFGIC